METLVYVNGVLASSAIKLEKQMLSRRSYLTFTRTEYGGCGH
jgi:hypothetical protein